MEFLIFAIAIPVLAGIFFYLRQKKRYHGLVSRQKEAFASNQSRVRMIYGLVGPVGIALEKGEIPDQALVDELAADPRTRFVLYEMLEAYDKAGLFPSSYLSHKASAESQMVHHLLHVHALGAVPAALEFEEKISVAAGDYYAFRYKAPLNHPAAQHGWMRGVCGPLPVGEQAYSWGLGSHVHVDEPAAKQSADAHVQWAFTHHYREPEPVFSDSLFVQ